MSISPSRKVAFTVLRRVFEDGAFADRALHSEGKDLSPRDRGLATTLVYGTVQRKRTLDHLLSPMVSRPLERLDPPILATLRLGAYQLLLLDGISDYAAVNESVELAKASGRGGAQMVNAVLRRITREGKDKLAGLTDTTAVEAAILHSVPDWLAEMWWEELGPQEARALLAKVNTAAESSLRVNTLKSRASAVLDALPAAVKPRPAPPFLDPWLPELPEGLVVSGGYDAYGSQLWHDGQLMPQSRGSMAVARALEPQPGERVLDLCAAPGGKTTHLAALMNASGEVVAVEVHPGRARALKETCALMGAGHVDVQTADARSYRAEQLFDRVLVDPPCSGLGTLQSRPDLRWQPKRGQLAELAEKQGELLRAGAANLKPGGTLVYSVCTIARAEGEEVIDSFLAVHPDFTCEHRAQLLPSRDGTDGFFIARLRRS